MTESYVYSGNVYKPAAGTTSFALTSTSGNAIKYLEKSDISVATSSDSGSTWTTLTRPAQWDFDTPGTSAVLSSGTSAGVWVRVLRTTPFNDRYTTFAESSLLTSDQLNDGEDFSLYVDQELYDQAANIDGGTSGPAVKKITGTAPVEVDSTNAQEPDISVDETVSTDNPNALTSDTRLMSEKAIDSAFSQAVGASGVYPPAGVTGKVGKLRIDDTGAEPKQFYWNGTAWVQIPTKGDKGDQGIPGPPPGLQDPAATANNVPLKANNVLGDATAAVTADGDGDLRFDFGIPVGQKGDKGDQGIEGIEGPVGPPPGLQSPAATATNVSLQPGNVLGQAYASVSADGSGDLKFNFGIPVGQRGEKGDVGDGVNYLGEIDATTAPAPSDPVNGDFYVNTVEGTSSWPGLGAVHVNSRLIYNSNTGQWDQYDPLDNVWREVGGEVYPVNAAADVKIGGVLPGAPAITLAKDGRITSVSKGGTYNFTANTGSRTYAGFYASDEAFRMGNLPLGEHNIVLNGKDGSATFANDLILKRTGAVYALLDAHSSVDLDITVNAGRANTEGRVKFRGSRGGGNLATRSLITAAGDIYIGGTLDTTAGSEDPNIELNADGSFVSGPISTQNNTSAVNYLWRKTTTAGDAVLRCKSNVTLTTGSDPFAVKANGDTEISGDVTIGGILSSAPNITLNASGSAEFAGTVKIGGTSSTDTDGLSVETTEANGGISIISPNDGRGDIFFGDSDNKRIGQIRYSHVDNSLSIRTNTVDRLTIDNSGNVNVIGSGTSAAPNIKLNASDGSATFAGSVTSGQRVGSSTTTDGVTLYSLGYINASRPGSADLWQGRQTGTAGNTSTISADGSASFTNTDAGKQFRLCQTLGGRQYMWATREADGGISSYLTSSGSATFARNVTSGGPDIFTGTDKGSIIGYEGNIGACCGASSSAFRAWTQGTSTPTVDIFADGSATFAGDITVGTSNVRKITVGNAGTISSDTIDQTTVASGGIAFGARDTNADLGSSFLAGYVGSNNKFSIRRDGSATFEGNVTAANVTFNLEPENPDNYTTTEEEYEVEVPVLRPDGPATADLVDGEPERETRTITRTREVTTYTGPTMDVKDTLLKITEALTQLKTAAASATTCEELRTAIDTALADV